MFVAARILLIIDGLLYLLVGVGVATQPGLMEPIGIGLLNAAGVTTTRTWGALFAGVGITALVAAGRRDWVTVGLLLVTIVSACILIARVIGIWIDGVEPRQWIELRREGVGCAIALLGLALALAKRKPVKDEF